ncbi:DUF4910 domain-containing protein [Palaeococcus sp. (in: euryarchaeotes)]
MERFLKEAEVLNPERILQDIGDISKFHRIQGSKELVEAAKYILEELKIWGIKGELFEVFYDGKSRYLTLTSPIAWDLVYAEVEVDGEKVTSERTPLVAMAHSPPGEAEGELVLIREEKDWERAEGKIVLVGSEWRENYRKANEKGAKGFLIYREGTGNAFPYVGLFLTEEDLKWAKIPAGAISEEWAKKIISKLKKGENVRARIKVMSKIPKRQILPMLYATIGKPPYILFSAHLCHPKPGANDNASGSAMVLELARVLSKLYNDSFRFGFAFLWIPEHFGTQAFIEKFAELEEYYVAINLDMVAGDFRKGSTIMIVKTPLSRFSMISGLLEYYLNLANSQGSGLSGSMLPKAPARSYSYEMGSDHDVFNFFGIPSVMPITWPDRFYHSSEDSIEKVSKETIEIIGKSVLATALALAKAEKGELKRFARAYVMKYLGELGMERETELAEKLVMKGLARDSKFFGIEIGHDFEFKPWLRWKRKGIISAGEVIRIDSTKGREFRELLKERRYSMLLHELLMLGEVLPREESFKALKEEYGDYEREKLERCLQILEELGFISLI